MLFFIVKTEPLLPKDVETKGSNKEEVIKEKKLKEVIKCDIVNLQWIKKQQRKS